ncbi:MAG: DSD1 family PLP-dependent enzyme [Proteobacteria bacterium]|nr:DSD1 family PLP-dependent enzyme [Pseudomonadota bacterium]MDA1356461.1 DSD1 family PLP-dependent enzyme [Pseudomonadota bacterium]
MANAKELGPNTSLIGQSGSRARLMTPALVLDLDALERNIARMKGFAEAHNISLRPHCKTHKSIAIARLQLDAGALGICAATLGEAEVIGGAGIPGVLVTSPVIADVKIDALMALNGRADGLMQSVDNIQNLRALDAAAGQAGAALNVVIDVDVGLHRTGASSVADAVALVEAAAAAENLNYSGVQAYAGHIMHIEDDKERRETNIADTKPLRDVCAALAEKNLTPPIVTGAGTGTYDIDATLGVMSEMQVGSYAVMDVEYRDVHPVGGGDWLFEPALFVRATVVSANHDGHATIDAGLKCFATDGPFPDFASGAPVGSSYSFFGDEHGRIAFAQANERLALGDAVECIVPHCDPTINLHDVYHCVRGDTLVDIWPVDARGRH